MRLPKKVQVIEVGPRDGFQAEAQWIPTERKIEIIDALSRTGIRYIQATSFVHPKAIPQLADADEVMAKMDRLSGIEYRVLIPNLKGLQRAIPRKPDRVNFVMSASESHNKANTNRSVDESLQEIEQLLPVAREAGVAVSGGMATAFGCPFEGDVPVSQVERIVKRYLGMGVTDIGIADTIGVANPRQMYDTCSYLLDKFPQANFSLHLHNTRDMALANVVAAMQAGFTSFDGAVGGLGGCPYAPGATGNVATEDLVYMLEEMGIETGVDTDALIAVARSLQEFIPHRLDSSMVRAGKRTDLKPAPKEQQKVG